MTTVVGVAEAPLVADLTCKSEVWLVRTAEASCRKYGYHKAEVRVGRFDCDPTDEKTCYSGAPVSPTEWQRTHGIEVHWPTNCDCGYRFKPKDRMVRLCFPVLRLPDGLEVTYHKLPDGCSWPDMDN